jgi:hypothetical protein
MYLLTAHYVLNKMHLMLASVSDKSQRCFDLLDGGLQAGAAIEQVNAKLMQAQHASREYCN